MCVCDVPLFADTACVDWVMCLYMGILLSNILPHNAGGDIKAGRGGRH